MNKPETTRQSKPTTPKDDTKNEHFSEQEIRLQKLEKLRDSNIEPFTYRYEKSHSNQTILDSFGHLETEDACEEVVSVAGRIIAKRGHGKATFGNILDNSASLQYFANVNNLGQEAFDHLLQLDVGDFIGVKGTPFRTKRGELSIRVSSVELLTKSLNPLPEKHHGLQDKEMRYRQRYVDLIANPEIRETFKKRSQIIRHIREFLNKKSFMEVETPVLHNIYGGAAARPFSTHHNELDQNLYLRIALELHLKRLIVGGFEKIFEIGRVFRNEGISYKHNPEYTLLELYQAYADYEDIMTLTEELISSLVFDIHGSYEIEYKEQKINFKPPFVRMTMAESLEKYAGLKANASQADLQEKAKALKLELPKDASIGQLIMEIYDKTVESNLIQPTFILDHPWETSPLAKRKRDNPELVERFELIISGMEIANAFSELNDPIDQHARFEDQQKAKESGYDEAHEMDTDYVNALKYGMPPTGGLGIGIDRIVMLITNEHSIRDVLFFPHMRNK
ncbi:MAG: lysyl-tRNA synthetase class 2 [Candidatus Marinamargulisbacteria bacterium]|jgi:lysyl-tRNA synthetase class 2